MLYELRRYDINPVRWDEFLLWAEDRAWPILQDQFGFRLVGRWQIIPKTGETAPSTNYCYILAWESEEEMRERRGAASVSPAWESAMAETLDPGTGESKYFLQIQSALMQPMLHSPLQ